MPPRFRIMPGQMVRSDVADLTGRVVSRSYLKPDRIKVRDSGGDTKEVNDADFYPIPDSDNIPMIIVKAIIAKAQAQKWSRARTIEELTRYVNRVLNGSES